MGVDALMKFLALKFLSCLAQEPSLVWILCGWQLVCQYLAEISRAVAEDSGTFETWLSCFLALKVRKVFLFPLFWSCCGDHEGATNVQIQIWKRFSQIPTAFGRWGSMQDRCVRRGISGFVPSFVSQHWCLLALASVLCLPLHAFVAYFHSWRVSTCFLFFLASWWRGIGALIHLFPQISLAMVVSVPDLFTYCCLLLSVFVTHYNTMLHNYLIFYFGVYNFERPRFTCCTRAPSKTCPCLQFSVTLCGSPILPSLGRMWWVL